MPSSTSSSEPLNAGLIVIEATGDAPPPRSVPATNWRAAACLALALTLTLLGRWEWQMRSLGLRTVDRDDGLAHWAQERRRIDRGGGEVVAIVGDSRSLFDTNLDTWQAVTGLRPIQLAIAGSSGLPILEDLAADTHFKGLVVLGVADANFFSGRNTLAGAAVIQRTERFRDYPRIESLAARSGHGLQIQLSDRLAFIDSAYTLFNVLGEFPLVDRTGVVSFLFPGTGTWKLSESGSDRQTWMWRRAECDANIRDQFRQVWTSFPATPIAVDDIDPVIERAAAATEKIRARGGDVVLLRPPSAGGVRDWEDKVIPRNRGWDKLVRQLQAQAIHFADIEEMESLDVPEWSHLSRESARRFTRTYVEMLCSSHPWLGAHTNRCALNQSLDND